MNEKTDKDRGLLIRILSSKDIQKGIAFFTIALILAFAAVLPVTGEDAVSEQEIEGDEHFEEIPYPGYRVYNATLELSTTRRVDLRIKDSLEEDAEVLMDEIRVQEGEDKIIDLTEIDSERVPRVLHFYYISGSLNYTYTVEYARRPYGLLSLPAGLFTLIGMVFAFKGKGIILGEIKRKQMEDEARKREEEREEEKKREKSTRGEEIEGEVIFEGEGTDEERGEADHVNFMGIQDEEDEEN